MKWDIVIPILRKAATLPSFVISWLSKFYRKLEGDDHNRDGLILRAKMETTDHESDDRQFDNDSDDMPNFIKMMMIWPLDHASGDRGAVHESDDIHNFIMVMMMGQLDQTVMIEATDHDSDDMHNFIMIMMIRQLAHDIDDRGNWSRQWCKRQLIMTIMLGTV